MVLNYLTEIESGVKFGDTSRLVIMEAVIGLWPLKYSTSGNVVGRDHSSPNFVAEFHSRTLHHTRACLVTGSCLCSPGFFWFLDLFPSHKNQNSKKRIEYDYSVEIYCEYFHKVIIISRSFQCQKLKLFLADGGKPWPMTEYEQGIEYEV